MTTAHTVGPKYEATRDLGIAEIAKLVRQDIKTAIAEGRLPAGLKCSVTIQRYSMGQSLDIRVTDAPFAVKVAEHEATDNRAQGLKWAWLTRDAVGVLETLGEIHSAYNYDNSDPQSDYHSNRYHGGAAFAIREKRITPADTAKALMKAEQLSHDMGIAALLTSCRMFSVQPGQA